MIERIYELLKEEKAGLSALDICNYFLSTVQISEPISERIVAGLLKGDPRFIQVQGGWRVREGATLLDRDLLSFTYVAVDVETTGISPSEHRITEIGAVKLEEGKVRGTFNSLVNPCRPIPGEITLLTGISQQMVQKAPAWTSIHPYFLDFLGSAVLIAHNASFDLGFINSEMRLAGEPALSNLHLCTLKLARRLDKGLLDHRLDTLASHYGLAVVDRHRALGDAKAAGKIFLGMLDKFRGIGFKTLRQVKELEQGG
jgi:DNA polymerase III epsilon subunit family exonuclease